MNILAVVFSAVVTGTLAASMGTGGASSSSSSADTSFGFGYPGLPSGSSPAGHFDIGPLLAEYFQALNIYHQYLLINRLQAAQAQQIVTQAAGIPGGNAFTGGFSAYPGYPPWFFAGNSKPDNNLSGVPAYFGIPQKEVLTQNTVQGHSPTGVGAGASAAIVAGGSHQSAFLTPENTESPNISIGNRLATDGVPSNGVPKGDETFSVFTSSSSSHMNVDGKETVHRQATTTVNENGKITSYTVHD